MPELPEVETVRRGLLPFLEGGRIERVHLGRPDLRFPLPERLGEQLAGRRVESLSRRAKYLLAEFSGDLTLAMHLGMSGSFRIEADGAALVPGAFVHPRSDAKRHDHVRFEIVTPEGLPAAVIFNDPRRFGYMTLIETPAVSNHPHFASLGLEPTGNALSGAALAPRLAGRKTSLKAALLDQRIIAGLGNIYVCEALWRAKLSPMRMAGSLVTPTGKPRAALDALVTHVRETIAEAIEAGGSTLRDHRRVDGTLGYFQHRFDVYDRAGEPCRRSGCAGTIARTVQSGRSTFYCEHCQR